MGPTVSFAGRAMGSGHGDQPLERKDGHANGPGARWESPVPATDDNCACMENPGGLPVVLEEGEWDISELIDLFGE